MSPDHPGFLVSKPLSDKYLKRAAEGWILYDRQEDGAIMMRRDTGVRPEFMMITPTGEEMGYVPAKQTPINRVRSAIGYALRQIREVWDAKTTYERTHRDWSVDQLQEALGLLATEPIIVARLYESASTDGYRTTGDGMFYDNSEAAMQSARARHSGYADGPIIHDALTDGKGRFYLLKCKEPISLASTEEARAALRRVALAKLSDEEKAALNVKDE
jgi:hypothetical protein